MPLSVAFWMEDELINEGLMPADPQQQAALYESFMSLFPAFCYEDDDGDEVTIVVLEDFVEACNFARSSLTGPDDVLHVRTKVSPDTFHHPLFARHQRFQDQAELSDRLPATQSTEQSPSEFHQQISRDIPRTWVVRYFPESSNTLLDATERVLIAFAEARPQIGYCQGMNSVAVALLLMARSSPKSGVLHLPEDKSKLSPDFRLRKAELIQEAIREKTGLSNPEEANAFGLLCKWADDILPPAFWTNTDELGLPSLAAVQAASVVVERILSYRNQPVAALLEEHLPVAVFVVRFLPALFVGSVPLETAMTIWDMVWSSGACMLMLAAASIVEMAVQPMVDTAGLDSQQVYMAVESFAGGCYDVSGLAEHCNSGPSVDTVSQWHNAAMIEHMEHEHTLSTPQHSPLRMVRASLEDVRTAVEENLSSLEDVASTIGKHMVSAAHLSDQKRRFIKACSSGNIDDVASYLSAAPDPAWLANAPNKLSFSGFTPLIAAARHGHPEILAVLLEAHADPTVKDWWGKTAMDYAEAYALKHPAEPRCTEMLRHATAQVHATRLASTPFAAPAPEAPSGASAECNEEFVEVCEDRLIASYAIVPEVGVEVRELPLYFCRSRKEMIETGAVVQVCSAMWDLQAEVLMLQLTHGGWVPHNAPECDQEYITRAGGVATCQHVGGVSEEQLKQHIVCMKGGAGCVRRIKLEFEAPDGKLITKHSRNGYKVELQIPQDARNIKVSFEAPAGFAVRAVNREDRKLPWIKRDGHHVPEVLELGTPKSVLCEIHGALTHSYVTRVLMLE